MTKVVYRTLLVFITLIILPVQLIMGLVIYISSGLPTLYHQRRVGFKGRIFTLYKFRTMSVGSDTKQLKLKILNEADGPVFKIRNDPRFTKLGRFLSHTGLDELPQLFNVLRGEMSLIGPRPLPVVEEKKLKKWQKTREAIKPGIISPWILEGYHAKTFDEWMKRDIEYIRQKSFFYDLQLTVRAAWFLITLLIKEIFHS